MHFYANDAKLANVDKPYSFYVNCIGLDDDGILAMIKHINAYMSYFDHRTPRILIHDDAISAAQTPRNRYLNGDFPKKIVARELDPNLLAYWLEMVATRNEVMRFLLCYRIIEYAAFNYVEPAIRTRIKRLLLAPSAVNDMDRLVGSIAEISAIAKGTDDIPRTQNLISSAVDLNLLWAEIERCKDYFCSNPKFDGGYEVKCLITKGDTFETWSNNGVRNTLDRLRGIRNALAHGQDTQTRATIWPTAQNSHIIRPWLNLIEIIAGETMLYRDVL